MSDYDLFVIGAGSGGVRAARISAGHGARVAVAEEHKVGGTCVIRGCVPKKLLVYGSHFAEDLNDAAMFGWDISQCQFNWPVLRDNVLAEVGRPIVLTSGNVSDEPIAYLDGDAAERLGGIADWFLVHDRPIHVRADDSVVRSFRGRELHSRSGDGAPPAGAATRPDYPFSSPLRGFNLSRSAGCVPSLSDAVASSLISPKRAVTPPTPLNWFSLAGEAKKNDQEDDKSPVVGLEPRDLSPQ